MKRRRKTDIKKPRKVAAPRTRKRKADPQYLSRPKRFMLRFNKAEFKEFFKRAEDAGLSKVEYGRRKILDRPVADITLHSVPAPLPPPTEEKQTV